MAAFTTLALLGAGAVAGAFAAKKLAPKPKPEAANETIVSTDAAARRPPIPIQAPPSVAQAGSSAALAAQSAAVKQRRRAAAGAVPSRPAPTGSILASRFEPRTLVGY